MDTQKVFRLFALVVMAVLSYSTFGQSGDSCPVITGVSERKVQYPPWGPSYYVDIHHNNVTWIKIIWRGTERNISPTTSPVSIQVDKRCMLSAETMSIEARKAGCDHVATTTYSVTPAAPVLQMQPVKGPPGFDQWTVRIPWKIENVVTYRLRAILAQTGRVLKDAANWEGTRAEGETGFGLTADMEGPVVITLTGCNQTVEHTLDIQQYKCDKECDHKCGEMPECVGDPVHTQTGNMRYTETDPLPANAFLPLQRTYLSRAQGAGFFGTRWFSMFDAKLNAFTDIDGTRYVSILTEDRGTVLFSNRGGQFREMGPGGAHGGSLAQGIDGSWTQTGSGGRLQRVFDAQGFPVAFREVATGREVRLTWTGGLPMRVEDSWGNWALNVTTDAATRRITAISVDGVPNREWRYVYSSHLIRVDSPVGTWRRYEYAGPNQPSAWWRLTVVRDGQGNLIEAHAYDSSGRALSSYGPSGEIDSIVPREPGRNSKEFRTSIYYRSGRVERHYRRWIAGGWRTVEVEGGCSSCGSGQYSAAVYDEHANVIRAQAPDGYITENTYDGSGHDLIRKRTSLRPSACDPATASDRCRLTTDALAATELVETPATTETAYAYEDPHWPHRVTSRETASVMGAGRVRRETTAYDPVTGVTVVHAVRGWTGDPVREETRTTTTALYDGMEGAAFAPGGAFDPAWITLPQPRMPRHVDRPGTSIAEDTTMVYYPVDAAVPPAWRGRLAATRNALGHITRFEDYDEYGNTRRTVDANGVVHQSSHDAMGRLIASTVKAVPGCDTAADPLCNTDVTSTRTYTGAGSLLSEKRAGGGVVTYQYDTSGRVTTVSRGPSLTDLRERMEYQYDPLTGLRSRERWLSFTGGTWVERKRQDSVYDSAPRLERLVHADGASVAYAYDPAGRMISTRDENHTSRNVAMAYDPAGRLTEISETLSSAAGPVVTRYRYDAHANMVSVTDPNGNETTYRYDDFGQMLAQISPVTGTTTYAYDAAGRLTSIVDANGATTTKTYDDLGRVITSRSVREGASEETTFAYDAGPFGTGRATSMSDPSGSTAFIYDRRGQLLSETKTIGAAVYTTAYQYDLDGNRSRIVYPSGRVANIAHDYAGRPTSASVGPQAIVTSATYLPFGPPAQLAFGNGTTRAISYDSRYRPATNALTGPQGAIASHGYVHDAVGNITAINDLLDAAYNRGLGYDDLNRLTSATTGSALWGAATYTYDAMGNLQSKTIGQNVSTFAYVGTTPKLATAIENGTNRSVTYDLAGNEIAAGAFPSTYSPRNHLQQTGATTYVYDGRGVRVRSTTPASENHFLYTPELNLMAEASLAAGVAQINYEYLWFGGQPAAQFETATGAVHYYHNDHLGTPILTTDSAAAVDWHIEREPYGTKYVLRAGASRHQPLAFPGQEESEGELSYNIFRWYRSGWGRYTQADPIPLVIRGDKPVPAHTYAYGASNPLDGSDPLGLSWKKWLPGPWGCTALNEECHKDIAKCQQQLDMCSFPYNTQGVDKVSKMGVANPTYKVCFENSETCQTMMKKCTMATNPAFNKPNWKQLWDALKNWPKD